MNPEGCGFIGFRSLSKLFVLAPFLAAVCTLVTGCPHNEYTVELIPVPGGMERTLTFYRTDGNSTNGGPNYLAFPTNELAAIVRVYPVGAVKEAGQRHVAKGEFAGQMPDDIGGAGGYTNLVTSLGEAGFYLERFRGNDDLAARAARQLAAADKITDLVIGWSKSEFGHERGWKNLRKFLDEDFRQDLKNAALYQWTAGISGLDNTNAADEFCFRFYLYLHERGYLKLADAPKLYAMFNENQGDTVALELVRRWIAEKLEISAAKTMPKSFAVLNDPVVLQKSWEKYLAGTDLYRAKKKVWEREKKTTPKLEPPKPLSVMEDLINDLMAQSDGEADHVTVKLALKQPPLHTNGKWQDGQVVWEADLNPARALPAFCYANWNSPNVEFQTAHFGRVVIEGDELTEYCLWQRGLDEKPSHEWESFLAGVKPGNDLRTKLASFQFTIEPGQTNQPDAGCKLLMNAVVREADGHAAGSSSK